VPPRPTKPTATQTPWPTASPTARPSSTPQACSIPQLLADTRANLPYPEAAITYAAGADRVLTVWYVDSALDPTADGQASLIALENLVTNASMMAIRLNHWSWPCMRELLDYLHVVVVDREYTGWFSGFISTDDLTSMAVPSVHQAESVEYIVEYVRQGPAPVLAPAPEGACSWAEAHDRIYQHVGPPDRNLGFYMYVDRSGVTAWAQWDETADLPRLVSVAPTLLNVVMELRCLYPRPDRLLVTVTGEHGKPILVGVLPGKAIQEPDYATAALEQFMVLGPPELLASPVPGAE